MLMLSHTYQLPLQNEFTLEDADMAFNALEEDALMDVVDISILTPWSTVWPDPNAQMVTLEPTYSMLSSTTTSSVAMDSHTSTIVSTPSPKESPRPTSPVLSLLPMGFAPAPVLTLPTISDSEPILSLSQRGCFIQAADLPLNSARALRSLNVIAYIFIGSDSKTSRSWRSPIVLLSQRATKMHPHLKDYVKRCRSKEFSDLNSGDLTDLHEVSLKMHIHNILCASGKVGHGGGASLVIASRLHVAKTRPSGTTKETENIFSLLRSLIVEISNKIYLV